MSRIWRGVAVVGVVAAAGAVTAATVGFGGTKTDPPTHDALPPATAQVTRQTLLDQEKQNGTLGYGTESTLKNQLGGTYTAITGTGTVVRRGETLYRVDNLPVILMYGTLPAYRALSSGTKGADVKQFEQELRNLGYTGFTVDEKYDGNTAGAVKKWQKKLGLEQTGTVELGRVVFGAGELRVGALKAGIGDKAQPGGEVFITTGTARLVTVKMAMSDQRLAAKGAAVKATLPDGKTYDGTITDVATVVETSGESSTTKVQVSIALATAVEGFADATVQVLFTADQRKDVLTVPVAALLALAEGGYGVQVVGNGQTKLVAVETGLFSGGRVEVRGADLREGLTVGMPT
jgi:multidrug efflux system membrane fusion protein